MATHLRSQGLADDEFVGLALDEDNEGDLTDDRITAWVDTLKAAL